MMSALENIDGLSECIGRAIQEHLAKSNLNVAWPQIDHLNRLILRVEAFLEDAGPIDGSRRRSERIASVCSRAYFELSVWNDVVPLRTGRIAADMHSANSGSDRDGDPCAFTKFNNTPSRL